MRVKEMGYDYTKDKLKKLYEQHNCYLGNWGSNGEIYLIKYDEYTQWITDYEQPWAHDKNCYHALIDFSTQNVPIVRGNFLVGYLLPNGEIQYVWTSHFLTAEKIEAIQERKMVSLSCHEDAKPQNDVDILEKIEKELAALMQRVEDSFGVPPSFFEKN